MFNILRKSLSGEKSDGGREEQIVDDTATDYKQQKHYGSVMEMLMVILV